MRFPPTRSMAVGAAVGALAASLCVPVAAAQPLTCETETAAVTTKLARAPGFIRARVERGLDKASALSRFHRRDDALAKLDALVALLDAPGGERLEDGPRKALTASIQALRRCAPTT